MVGSRWGDGLRGDRALLLAIISLALKDANGTNSEQRADALEYFYESDAYLEHLSSLDMAVGRYPVALNISEDEYWRQIHKKEKVT